MWSIGSSFPESLRIGTGRQREAVFLPGNSAGRMVFSVGNGERAGRKITGTAPPFDKMDKHWDVQ